MALTGVARDVLDLGGIGAESWEPVRRSVTNKHKNEENTQTR